MSVIPRKEFELKYGLSENILNVKKSKDEIPTGVIKSISKGKSFIDESFFTRRKDFQEKVFHESIEMYYFFTKYTQQFELSRILHKIDSSISRDSWNTFMSVTLFNIKQESILRYKLSRLSYKFYRYMRWIIRGLFILAKVPLEKRDISVILDRY